MERVKQSYANDLCECDHKRKEHGKTHSINYTEGKCAHCDCQHFMIGDNEPDDFTGAGPIGEDR